MKDALKILMVTDFFCQWSIKNDVSVKPVLVDSNLFDTSFTFVSNICLPSGIEPSHIHIISFK